MTANNLKLGGRYRFTYRHPLVGTTERITGTVVDLDFHAIRVVVSDGKSGTVTHDHSNHYLDPLSIVGIEPVTRPREQCTTK